MIQTPEEAIFHLALLGMYADGNLALAEDQRISQLLSELGLGEDTGVQAAIITLAFDRVRAAAASDEATAAFLTNELKGPLSAPGQKDRALASLKQVLDADGKNSSGEKNLFRLSEWML